MATVKKTIDIEVPERDIQIIKLLCEGKTYKEVGAEMHLSGRTIGGIRDKMLSRYRVKTTIELVAFFFREKLVE